jgi:hypothetical protein
MKTLKKLLSIALVITIASNFTLGQSLEEGCS